MREKKIYKAVILVAVLVVLAASAGYLVYHKIWGQDHRLSQKELSELNIVNEEVEIPGLTKEYQLFFMADSHISLCDDKDAQLQEKADQRKAAFVDADGVSAEITFAKMVEASNTLGADMFLMGGDVIDSAMYASIDFVKEQLTNLEMPYLYSLGNHDFEYGEEYFSDKAYEEYLPRLGEITSEETYQIVEYDDLIIFAANDKNNQIAKTTLEGLKSVLDKGKPIVLILHVPLQPVTGDMALIEKSIEVWGASKKGRSKVVIGENGCKPKETTSEFIQLVTAEDSPISLVLGGHIHFYHKDNLTESIPQIVTGAAYEKNALFVTLKPMVAK